MAALTPDGLLRAAKDLLPPRPGRPPDASIRRSISTAYYAIFAAASEEVARRNTGETRIVARRLLDHGSARDVCSTLASQRRIPWLTGHPACSADVEQFSMCFLELQSERERADYDDAYEPKKDDALAAIATARRGVECLRQARNSCPDQVQAICVAMVAGPAARRRMIR